MLTDSLTCSIQYITSRRIILPILLKLIHLLLGTVYHINGLQHQVIDVRSQQHVLRRLKRGVLSLDHVVLRDHTRDNANLVVRLEGTKICVAVIGVIAHFIRLILARLDDDVIGIRIIAYQIRTIVVTDDVP